MQDQKRPIQNKKSESKRPPKANILEEPPKSNLDYWRDYLKNAHPLIKDWLNKEEEYLKKHVKKGSTVLDVGCGFGRNMRAIADIAGKIIGIDNDAALFDEIKQNLADLKNIGVLLGDATELPFKNGTFDYVVCMGNTFGNLGDSKLKALSEMKRVAKKDGKIIISVYSENALDVRLREYKKIGVKIKKVENGTVYTEDGLILEQFDKKRLTELFSSIGLKAKIVELNPLSYLCEATVE